MTIPKETIDKFIEALTAKLESGLSSRLASITLVGSYVAGDLSPERPNVNMLLFTKPDFGAEDYFKAGEIPITKNW